MLAALNRLVKGDMVRTFSLTAIATVVRMLTGFVSVKIVSGLIGPGGIALLGQLSNFSAIFLTFSTGGINLGVTKYISEYSESKNKVNLVLKAAFWITGIMSLISGFTLIIGSTFFSKIILQDVRYSTIIAIFGCTIIFYSFNSLLLSVLNGYRQFKKYVIISIVSSLTGLLFTITLVFYLGVYGALLSAVTFESVILLVTLFLIAKDPLIRNSQFFGKINTKIVGKLANYSLMALISAATVPISQLVIRSSIVKNSSLADAGIWEGMNRLSAMYLLVITSSLGIYYLPKLSAIQSQNELRKEIMSAYKVVLPPLIVILTLMFLMRKFIIDVVFNDRFQGMQELFAFQMIGDFFKICSWILAYQMLAKSMTKSYIITEIGGSLLFVSLAIFFIRIYGNLGASMGYAITYIIYFFVMIATFRKLLFAYAK